MTTASPVALTRTEIRHYRALRNMLADAGIGSAADVLLVAELARWIVRAEEAAATLAEDGAILEAGTNGAKYQHPALKVAATCATHVTKLCARLGLDPTTRHQWGIADDTHSAPPALPDDAPPRWTPPSD
jgi:P27 family predicted phage terminase small subunit